LKANCCGRIRKGIVMESARDAARAGIIEPVLYGVRDDIAKLGGQLDWDIWDIEVIEAGDEVAAADRAAKDAGSGHVAAIMKGHVHTDNFMRAILNRDAGLRTGRRLSHVFVMSIPGNDRPLLISDCALNTQPDEATLQAILLNIVDVAHALGISRPAVALLSATEEVTENIPSSVAAEKLADWAQNNVADADVHGPLAMDLAVSPESAKIKGVSGPVAGKADAIVVPEIVSGNALFKSLVHFSHACAAGIVLGAKVPVLLTSRADPAQARLASAAVAAIYQAFQATGKELA
jgi:phosphate acetyltransferase